MENNRTLSAEHQARLASSLLDAAVAQQDNVSNFMGKCDALLGRLETAMNAFESRTAELTRDMPSTIAREAATRVVQEIADLVTQKVADVLQPMEVRAQTLLRAMEEPIAIYRRVARHPVIRHPLWTVIIFACFQGLLSAVLVVLIMKIV
jgi:hypothetical protein